MGQHQQDLENAGLQILAVGLGEPKHAVRYCEKLVPGVECLTREETEVHRAYGIERMGLKDIGSGLDLLKAGSRAAAAGHKQGQATGDTAMKPATFIVDGDGIIRYKHYSTHPGDHPAIEALIAAVAIIQASKHG